MHVETVPPVDEKLLAAAVEVARAGGVVTVEWFNHHELEVESKADGSPVTQADLAAEHAIRDRIETLTPNSTIVGEEHGREEGTSGLTWYVDPIDGTKAFSRGIPTYATLVAVDDEHGPAAGVIFIPALDRIVYAGRGRGCFTNSGPAHVSDKKELKGGFLSTSCVSRWPDGVYDRVRATGANIHGWGDGFGFLLVATGEIEAMVDLVALGPWDVAPLRVIMPEAGGRYSALDASQSVTSGDGVASNGHVHDDLLAAING